MMPRHLLRPQKGITLIEILVVFAIIAVILVVATPSVSSMIEMQRLRGVNDQLVTDVQFLRTEAATRQELTGITFRENATMTCYIIHTCGTVSGDDCECNCTAAEGSRCVAPRREVRTVQLLKSAQVIVKPTPVSGTTSPNRVMIDPATGSISAFFATCLACPTSPPIQEFWAQTSLTGGTLAGNSLQVRLSPQGRPSICSPGGAVKGAVPCP